VITTLAVLGICFLCVLYAISIRYIGLPIAQAAWDVWDKRENGTRRAKLLFPLYNWVSGIGEDYYGWAHPFVPIVDWHGHFSGKGFGVLESDPSAKSKYISRTAIVWPAKVFSNIVGLVFIWCCLRVYRAIIGTIHLYEKTLSLVVFGSRTGQ